MLHFKDRFEAGATANICSFSGLVTYLIRAGIGIGPDRSGNGPSNMP